MEKENFDKLVHLSDLIRVGMLEKYHLDDFLELVKEDDYFTYEVVKTYPPFNTLTIEVTIQFGEIYFFAIEGGKPLGTTVVYKGCSRIYSYFVSYDTMVATAWQPYNPNMTVSTPKG